MTTQTHIEINGVNIDQLVESVNAVQQEPSLAVFRFRAHNEWISGGHSRTSIQGFYGAGSEDATRAHPFLLDGDEPPVLLGGNAGPNAVEVVLHALASCLAVGFAYNAAAQGIQIDSLRMDVEGDFDLRGFLGLSKDVRPGYQNIHLTCRVQSDASPEKLEDVWNYVQSTSPVLDILCSPVPVTLQLESQARP